MSSVTQQVLESLRSLVQRSQAEYIGAKTSKRTWTDFSISVKALRKPDCHGAKVVETRHRGSPFGGPAYPASASADEPQVAAAGIPQLEQRQSRKARCR